MSRYGITGLIMLCGLLAAALVILFPQVTRSETNEKTLEQRVAALEQELASRPKTAIVDLEAVVNGYKKTADLRAKRKDFIESKQKEVDAIREAIASLKERQDKAVRDSEDWWDCEGKIATKERVLELRTKQIEEEIKNLQMKDLEDVYKDIVAVVRKIAADKGLDLVCWKHSDIDEETWKLARMEGNLMSHRYMLDIRPILYTSNNVADITQDVRKVLPAAEPAPPPDEKPVIKVTVLPQAAVPAEQEKIVIAFEVSSKTPLKSVRVSVNGKEIFKKEGEALAAPEGKPWASGNIDVPLAEGDNKVEIIAEDAKGQTGRPNPEIITVKRG
jgi:Skp family chaperone for outer membrane proteins